VNLGRRLTSNESMAFLFIVVVFAVLLAISWPIALLLMILVPFLWILSIPFRIAGILLEAVLAVIRQVLLIPARILGYR
jgi:hypothetical protein